MLQGMFGKALLEPVLKLKMTELQDICGNGNEMYNLNTCITQQILSCSSTIICV